MGNRNVQGRTLLPHQRKIWTEAFKASMHHTSIESAERKAWQAVDICERVGAFHESTIEPSISETSNRDFRFLWKTLYEWFDANHEGLESEQIDQPLNAMVDVETKGATESDFKESLRSIFDGSD